MNYEVLKSVWSALGPLLGVFVGAWLATRGQHTQWVKDRKQQEYAELLDILRECYQKIELAKSTMVMAGEEHAQLFQAQLKAARTIQNRLFIDEPIKRNGVLEKWRDVEALSDRPAVQEGIRDLPVFRMRDLRVKFETLIETIKQTARIDLEIE